MMDEGLSEVQKQARAWLDAQNDTVTCERHRARHTLTDCARRIAGAEMVNGKKANKLTDKQKQLQQRWAGCEDCQHAQAAIKLIKNLQSRRQKYDRDCIDDPPGQ